MLRLELDKRAAQLTCAPFLRKDRRTQLFHCWGRLWVIDALPAQASLAQQIQDINCHNLEACRSDGMYLMDAARAGAGRLGLLDHFQSPKIPLAVSSGTLRQCDGFPAEQDRTMTPHHVNSRKRGKVAERQESHLFHGPRMHAPWLPVARPVSGQLWGNARRYDRQPPAIGRCNTRDA